MSEPTKYTIETVMDFLQVPLRGSDTARLPPPLLPGLGRHGARRPAEPPPLQVGRLVGVHALDQQLPVYFDVHMTADEAHPRAMWGVECEYCTALPGECEPGCEGEHRYVSPSQAAARALLAQRPQP